MWFITYLFMNKILQKYEKNILTDGEVMSKIKVASFLWDTVYNVYIAVTIDVCDHLLCIAASTFHSN